MNRKTLLLTCAALGVWALVGLRYVNLADDAVPTIALMVDTRAQGPGVLRAAFTLPDSLSYPDPFASAPQQNPEQLDAPPEGYSPFGAPQASFGQPPLTITVQGVVGSSALVVMPDGQTVLVREGDYLRAAGFAEAEVTRIHPTGLTLTVAGERVDFFVTP